MMMLGTTIDVAVGLTFFYVVLSLICSSIQEVFARVFGLRARNLKKGIENLLGSCYTNQLYSHALITGLHSTDKIPSYIESRTFATALLDVIAHHNASGQSVGELSMDELLAAIKAITNKPKARQLLLSMANSSASKDVNGFTDQVATWFDANMKRVGGWYKRQVMGCLLIIATTLTLVINADSVRVVDEMWRNAALRATIAAAAEQISGEELKEIRTNLETFPIGYAEEWRMSWSTAFGWLLTIAAISLGAPFWFDLLGRFANLRATGDREGNKTESKGGE